MCVNFGRIVLFPIFFGDNRAIVSALNYPSWVVGVKLYFCIQMIYVYFALMKNPLGS